MRSLAFLAGLFVAATAAAATYRWVDRNGVVHYSDRPAPGAVLIDTGEAQTFSTPPIATGNASAAAGQQAQPAANAEPYRTLEVWQPENDETLTNTGNQVTVRLRLEPGLRAGHSIWLYLDGKRVDGLPDTGETFALTEVYRGTHTLSAIVSDPQGTPQIRSPSVTFHVRQTSTLTGPRT